MNKTNWKDILAAGAMRFLIRILGLLSLDAAGHAGDFLGRTAYWLMPGKREIAYWNMRRALLGAPPGDEFQKTLKPEDFKRILHSQFRHLGRNLFEILTFEKLSSEEINKTIQIEGWERIGAATDSGHGVVLLTAHYGNWELMQVYSGIRGKPVHVLGRDQKYPRLNEILIRQREIHGSVAVSRGMNVRFLLKALKERQLVGVLGDQSAGRAGGILLPIFGRVTTVPTGAFELARRTDAVILPCFMRRIRGREHKLFVGEALHAVGADDEEKTRNFTAAYLKILEKNVREAPDQWLWQNKRWKYSWTRHVTVLSDKKPGHFKQSEAVAGLFNAIKTYHGRPGLEFKIKTVNIEYRSEMKRKLLFCFGGLLLPFIRGRLSALRYFLTNESVQGLHETQADFIIAAGSSLASIQHLFAAETGAKKIVLMKPPLPYGFLNYDLAIVPQHDDGHLPRNVFRSLISPSGHMGGSFDEETALLTSEMSPGNGEGAAVFIGGSTHDYDLTVADAEKILSVLEKTTSKKGGYVLTTSRRTSLGVERFFKHQIARQQPSACRKLIVASEDTRSFIARGMLGWARIFIVTEDSLAMISEVVATGKPVFVLRTAPDRLPEKHRRFLENLIERRLVTAVNFFELNRCLSGDWPGAGTDAIQAEKDALVKELEKLL